MALHIFILLYNSSIYRYIYESGKILDIFWPAKIELKLKLVKIGILITKFLINWHLENLRYYICLKYIAWFINVLLNTTDTGRAKSIVIWILSMCFTFKKKFRCDETQKRPLLISFSSDCTFVWNLCHSNFIINLYLACIANVKASKLFHSSIGLTFQSIVSRTKSFRSFFPSFLP